MSRAEQQHEAHLRSTTQAATSVIATLDRAAVAVLTIVAHPDPERVGETVALPELASGKAVSLSRLEPLFAPPRGGDRRPLADPRLSRKPLVLAPRNGGVELSRAGSPTRVAVDGCPVSDALELRREALELGAVLLLARRVALVLRLGPPISPADDDLGLIGESAAIVQVQRQIRRVANQSFPVLLRGESGTGKEIAAHAVHQAGPRRGFPFVDVNLAAVPRELAAAELFGAAKGAFTGAERRRDGYFQRAHRGTLFLDEIGEASAAVQVLLLRALETGQVQPVGAAKAQVVDVRVVSATDADLEAAVETGDFRSPLLHRLTSFEIEMPALRDRREDLGRLFFHFLRAELETVGEAERLRPAAGKSPGVPAELVQRLALYHWPGNVRQLRNVVRRIVVTSHGEPDLRAGPRLERLLATSSAVAAAEPATVVTEQHGRTYRPTWVVEETDLLEALAAEQWNVRRTASRLGVSRSTAYRLIADCSALRKVSELSPAEVAAADERFHGAVDAMAKHLRVSPRSLLRHMRKLGLR